MKKEEEDKGSLKGSRTTMNGYKSSIYKGLRWKGNEKKEEDDCWSVNAWTVDGSRIHIFMNKSLQTQCLQGFEGKTGR